MRSWKVFGIVYAVAMAALAVSAASQDGPMRDSGPAVARPKRPAPESGAPAETSAPKIPSQFKKDAPSAEAAANVFKSDVELVTLDVAVLDPKGRFIPNIPAGNFRVLEDNVPQKISKVDMAEAPMTVAMVVEWSSLFQQYGNEVWFQTLQLVWGFAQTLKPQDYCAVIAFDMKPEMLTDFTTDRGKIQEALSRLKIPAWRESNLFDAITDTADRMSAIEGRKAIVLVASGMDTFSKKNFDETRKILQQSGVPVYAIGLMQTLRILAESRMGAVMRMDFLQADNQMRTFANETGGQAFFPRFEGEFPTIFQAVEDTLRHQYTVSYSPSNKAHDGTFRKLKVQLVNPATGDPLPMKDEKGKPVKYTIVAKAGYKAPRPVE
jgi:Ca-activated chloride channel homolog